MFNTEKNRNYQQISIFGKNYNVMEFPNLPTNQLNQNLYSDLAVGYIVSLQQSRAWSFILFEDKFYPKT